MTYLAPSCARRKTVQACAPRKAVDFTSFRNAFAAGDSAQARAFYGLFATPIVEAAFNALTPPAAADTMRTVTHR